MVEEKVKVKVKVSKQGNGKRAREGMHKMGAQELPRADS